MPAVGSAKAVERQMSQVVCAGFAKENGDPVEAAIYRKDRFTFTLLRLPGQRRPDMPTRLPLPLLSSA